MPIKHHFKLRAFAIVVAPANNPSPPGEYHWHKLKNYHDPAALKKKLMADKRFTFQQDLIDHDRDIVGYGFETSNMAQFRNAVKKILGPDHGLMVTEMGSSRASRKLQIQTYRRQGNFDRWWLAKPT
jgi:hypothetical protein